MQIRFFKDSFQKLCEENKFEKNTNQLKIIDSLIEFIIPKKNIFNIFSKPKKKLCFYLSGDVGVGKTMILNHFFKSLTIQKQRFHFNEFMICFHEFRFKNKDNSIYSFVKKIKIKNKLIYLDELQVTNIVDAMILGKLFEIIFKENIKVIITSNFKIDDLYKNGLQRDQFKQFISIIKKNSIQKELVINRDYRKSFSNNTQRAFYPINEKTSFKINQLFRGITKNKKKKLIKLVIKGREIIISDFYDGIAKFDFKDLCEANKGAEDYIKIAEICKFVLIKNIPNFNNDNANQQQRFIVLIDIFYENKIPLIITVPNKIESISTSKKLSIPFKRTLSRLHEMTSSKVNFHT
jgi:cell division protein ZapE